MDTLETKVFNNVMIESDSRRRIKYYREMLEFDERKIYYEPKFIYHQGYY